jgi:DNA repair protein RecN (Recombination protein N)
MLTQIHIINLATIEQVHLDLSSGTTVITGETGAGKSIIMDAIDLALGGRASPHLIRANQDKMDIRLCFDLGDFKTLPDSLKNSDFDLQTQECIVRRTITRDGRSRTFINDLPVTLPVLREFSEALVDIHGQHEHQSLLKPEKQRELLDRFGNHQELCATVRELAEQHKALTQELLEMQHSSQQRDERRDFLRFQCHELEALHLQPDEWQALEAEHKQLAHADTVLQNLTFALAILSQEEEKNVAALLHRVAKALESIKEVNPLITQWAITLHTATLQLDDMGNEIRHYLDTVDLNPARLQAVEQRIQAIHDVARKYKTSPAELPTLIEKIKKELTGLEENATNIAELLKKQEALEKCYREHAQQLSEQRIHAAQKLAQEITHTIQTLALPHAEFQIALVKEDENTIAAHGLEKITFLVKTNRGAAFHPLAKIASGGELSRISLAIHLATAEQHTIPTLIFDEVDVGIGGGTAELVGKLLRRLGKTHQVLCITHLPQVAAWGNQHIAVEKIDQPDQTYTQLRALTLADKIKEIARMLGGIHITATTLKHAQEMLESCQLSSASPNSRSLG